MSTYEPGPRMHLSLNLSEFGRHSGAWRHPDSDVSGVPSIDRYVEFAKTAERGKFDLVFIADTPSHAAGRTMVTGTRLDPLELLAAVATETSHIGMIATISTSYNEPFDLARRAASLDLLSGGRLGVNYVATSGDATAWNFNLDHQLPHDQRYVRSNEFLEVVTELWEGAGDRFVPPKPIDHIGPHFEVRGALDVLRPDGGRPLIVQAGSSPDGRDLAARWADAIYAGGSTLERAQEYYRDVKARTAAYGRDPSSIKILLGVMPFIGETEQAAHDLHRMLDDYHLEGADVIRHLSGLLEFDLSGYDPDGPLPLDELPEVKSASVSQATLFTRMAREEGLSIAETARRSYVGGLANMQWVVTGTSLQVADEMQKWFEAGTADGFAVVAPMLPQTIDAFVAEVVPELQRRGLVRQDYEGATVREHLGLAPVTSPESPPSAS
ncbi:NtaA/DmoA family FMN-dependent monooxygenase [Saccharopolyspora sp. K220]|uniref:NtaA/DmoA family FMN-dependent monooxygenase n=1 Tax=Saccharopolyspora soli TaxID=2926618 RepID=UPI001F5A3927|nr:NtaA/DmoA family FMN-dependent monooxygenase [Saccharopolyspora soli]MCI2422616.1 NtaA/DmoA family FMN-dependent monooxygenase [Saccharopolyspora soli]